MPTGIQTNRTAVALPTDVSQEVMQLARGESAIMQLARRIPLPGRGLSIPTITADPEAEWVDETAAKPVKNPGVAMKTMKGYKLAVILPFSNEFRRDLAALYDNIVARLPGALAMKFDRTVLGAVQAPGEHFGTLTTATKQSILAAQNFTAYDGLVAAYENISTAGGILNGFAMGPQGYGLLLGAQDKQGRPLFLPNSNDGRIPGVLGAQIVQGRGVYVPGTAPTTGESATPGTPAVVGVAGDWSQAMYGMVQDIQIEFSDQATLTYTDANNQTVTINLWQRNMFAVRCEFEAGFVANVNAFNLLTGAIPSA